MIFATGLSGQELGSSQMVRHILPAGSSLNLWGGYRQGAGRVALPGANARHKSSISLQSDFQSCRNGIIKIDTVGESVPADTRLAFLTAPNHVRILCPPGFTAGIPFPNQEDWPQ